MFARDFRSARRDLLRQPAAAAGGEFTPELRARTEDLAATMHRPYRIRAPPPATPSSYCRSCSLVDICLPEATAHSDAGRWVALQLRSLQQQEV